MAKGEGAQNSCVGCMWAFCWFLVLICLAWPFALFFSTLYVILLPLEACIKPLKNVLDPLLQILQFPLNCGQNMVNMTPLC